MTRLPIIAYLFAAAILLSNATLATYVIDVSNIDTDPAVQCNHNSALPGVGHPWFYYPPETGLIDSRRMYGGNSTSSWCLTANGCWMTIGFNGTGLTMYAAAIWSFAFNASLDGLPPATHEFDGVLGCCNDAIQPVYNFSIYNIQSLPAGSHSLRISLLDSISGSRPPNVEDSVSVLMFDYAVVNTTVDTILNPPSTTDSSQSPRKRSVPLGAIIGGAIGGAAVILALLLALCNWERARRRHALDSGSRTAYELASESNVPGAFLLHNAGHNQAQMNLVAHQVPVTGHSLWTGPKSPTLPLPNIQTSSTGAVVVRTNWQPPLDNTLGESPLNCTGPESPTLPSPNIQTSSASPLPMRTQPPLDNTSDRVSTVEDGLILKKLNDLHQSVAEIANVVDAMRAERETANRVVESTMCRDLDPDPDDDPPSYGH